MPHEPDDSDKLAETDVLDGPPEPDRHNMPTVVDTLDESDKSNEFQYSLNLTSSKNQTSPSGRDRLQLRKYQKAPSGRDGWQLLKCQEAASGRAGRCRANTKRLQRVDWLLLFRYHEAISGRVDAAAQVSGR